MPNGEGGPLLEWWQAALGGLGSLLMGLGIGLRRGRHKNEDTDIIDEKTSVRLIEMARSEHLATRVEIRIVLDKVKLEFDDLMEKIQEEHEEQQVLLRAEGKSVRELVLNTATELAKQVNTMHRDMIDRTRPKP